MKRLILFMLITASLVSFTNYIVTKDAVKVKCMVQLINYEGEGAYVAVSLLDAEGKYIKTLRMLGDDPEWYPDLSKWFSFFKSNNKPNIDAITGASIAGGERSIFSLEIAPEFIDAGYQLRFETAVENQMYHENDVVIPLKSENLKGSFDGNGYVRYVRLIASK